jgi:hypothetical protein
MAAFQFYLQLRKKQKVGQVGDDSHVVFGKKNFVAKRKSEKVHCHYETASYFVAEV